MSSRLLSAAVLMLLAALAQPLPAWAEHQEAVGQEPTETQHPVAVDPGGRPAPGAGQVPYIIVTDTRFAEAFEDLAAFHSRRGRSARVRTTAWIRSAYPTGRDLAESIRMFLQDAHTHWGSRFLLLGGDEPLLPMRRAHVDGLPEFVFGTTTIDLPTDRYYACLDGDWNADGDDYWGESDDAPDEVPELAVGRAPVLTLDEAERFVESTRRGYNRMDRGREIRSLFIAPRASFFGSLFQPNVEQLHTTLDTLIANRATRLYAEPAGFPGAQLLDRRAFERALQRGPDLVFLMATGGREMFTFDDGGPPVGPAELSAIGGARSGLVIALPGFMTAPGGDSDGRALLLAREGGADAVIGATNTHLIGVAFRTFETALEPMYAGSHDTIGECWNDLLALLSSQRDIPSGTIGRLTTLGMTLLGDPALTVPGRPAHRPDHRNSEVALGLPPSSGTILVRDIAHLEFDALTSVAKTTIRAEILDVTGRRVRVLATSTFASNGGRLDWDLRDSQGVRVTKGLYFVRLLGGATPQVRRVVVN